MHHILRGQWTGNNSDDAFAIVNINESSNEIYGRLSVLETKIIDSTEYSLWQWATIEGKFAKSDSIEGSIFTKSIHNRYGIKLTSQEFDEFKEKSNLEYPVKITFTGIVKSETELTITVSYSYPSLNQKDEIFKLTKTAKSSSTSPHQHMKWEDFKSYALQLDDGLIFRGQAKSWPLQTSYHRTGYADLVSYLDNEIIDLEHHINAVSNHPYNIHEDRSLGALLNLAQHHGYPTPLLDWTKSPYVAAFFAFENKEELKKNGKISIFIFKDKKWSARAGKDAPMRAPHIMVRTVELPGFNNPRVLPQQAITMFSNMNDIEQIIQANEETKGDFLTRITMDVSEADKAMRDLKLMGLTWGSLFPGFDGICKQLKSRHFD